MATQLFNDSTCLVRNWHVDINNDGTTARTAAQVNAPVNTHSAVPTHHAHHSFHRHKSRAQRKPSQPISMLIYKPKNVLRLLNAVAVLQARRDQLVLAWETWDELKDQNKKNIPDHSGRPEFLKGTFLGATTVETGDMNVVLNIAKSLRDQWMREFLYICKKDPKNSWPYLVRKRDEGHEHLAAMAKVYSRAALINVHSRQHADTSERLAKTIKLSMDVLVTAIGTMVGKKYSSSPGEKAGNAAFAIDVAYALLTQETIGEHIWGVSPEMVGMEAQEHVKERGKETAKDVGWSVLRESANKLAEFIEHTMGHKAKEIMLRSLGDESDDYALAISKFRKLVQKDAMTVWEEFQKTGKISGRSLGRLAAQGEALAMREGTLLASNMAPALARKAVTKGEVLSGALRSARWVYVAYLTIEKCQEIRKVWKAPIEGEEQKEEPKGEASHE